MSSVQTVAQLLSGQIVSSLLIGLLLASFVALLLPMVAPQNSRVRFAVRFAALIAIAVAFFWKHPAYGAAGVHSKLAEIYVPGAWALYVFGAWGLVAFAGLVQVLRGLWRVRALRRGCTVADAEVTVKLTDLLSSARRRVCVLVSDRVRVPAAIGFIRPAIVLPRWTLTELSPEELRTVVLHELAHLDRWDDWTNLAQKLIRTLLFFHPAVWWIESRLSIEREMSCDDIVLARSPNPRRYAACLISLAEKSSARRSMALAQGAVAKLHHTAQRISRILDGRQRKLTPIFLPSAAALVAFLAVGLVTASRTSHLVAFQNAPSAEDAQSTASLRASEAMPGYAIPAAFHPGEALHAKKLVAPAHHPTARTLKLKEQETRINNASGFLEAREQQNIVKQPAVVKAAMHGHASPQFVYVVLQTTEYDSWGRVTVTTSVWRLKVGRSAPARVQNAGPPRST
jgi:bla regulator protein blaR1